LAHTPKTNGAAAPELSAIIATDGLAIMRRTFDALMAQTARDRLELVIVSPAGSIGDEELAGLDRFHSVQVVERDTPASTSAARAAGIRAASAPVVALVETHVFPQPGWAAALIEAHRGPWTVVGPLIDNENPGPASWGNLFVDYSPWLVGLDGGEMTHVAGHNATYKREALLRYWDDLDWAFEAETVMHWEMHDRGERIYCEPRAVILHRNVSRFGPGIVEHFYNGQCFGGIRSRNWSLARRALYALASPIFPLLRLWRIGGDVRRMGRLGVLPGALPMMAAALAWHAAGECVGYVRGRGRAGQAMARFELYRDRYVAGLDGVEQAPPAKSVSGVVTPEGEGVR
jgi:hypothetical protein